MTKEEFHNNEMPKIKAFLNAQKELNKASKSSILNFRKKANENKRKQEQIQLSCFCQQLVKNIEYN